MRRASIYKIIEMYLHEIAQTQQWENGIIFNCLQTDNKAAVKQFLQLSFNQCAILSNSKYNVTGVFK